MFVKKLIFNAIKLGWFGLFHYLVTVERLFCRQTFFIVVTWFSVLDSKKHVRTWLCYRCDCLTTMYTVFLKFYAVFFNYYVTLETGYWFIHSLFHRGLSKNSRSIKF